MTIPGKDLIIDRADLSNAILSETQFPDAPPPGHVLLKVVHYALTANTITYGTVTDSLGYWNFFPAARDGFGRIPAWGFADVVASAVDDVPEGIRVYGYVPMSTHLMVQPGKISKDGFTDITPHRQLMSAIYNRYSFTQADSGYAPDKEAHIALFRPLFTTSFLLADFLTRNQMFGGTQLVLSSASSKTALGLAAEFKRVSDSTMRVVGLTSAQNKDFVDGLHLFDDVIPYDAVETLSQAPSVYVDFSGNGGVTLSLHRHLDGYLMHSAQVGVTDWQNANLRVPGLPGPKPLFFFAPSYAQERVAEWGPAGFQNRLGAAWAGFMGQVGWLKVVRHTGPEHARARYLTALSGAFDPTAGDMVSLWPE